MVVYNATVCYGLHMTWLCIMQLTVCYGRHVTKLPGYIFLIVSHPPSMNLYPPGHGTDSL